MFLYQQYDALFFFQVPVQARTKNLQKAALHIPDINFQNDVNERQQKDRRVVITQYKKTP